MKMRRKLMKVFIHFSIDFECLRVSDRRLEPARTGSLSGWERLMVNKSSENGRNIAHEISLNHILPVHALLLVLYSQMTY
jgi:hypothetical protein